MSSFEIKIWSFSYIERSSSMCTRRTCYLDDCRETEEPCTISRTKVYEVVISFSYPDGNDKDRDVIFSCANYAIYVASGIVIETDDACVEFDTSCMEFIERSVIVANEEAREAFLGCLRQQGLSEDVISKCEVRVLTSQYYL